MPIARHTFTVYVDYPMEDDETIDDYQTRQSRKAAEQNLAACLRRSDGCADYELMSVTEEQE